MRTWITRIFLGVALVAGYWFFAPLQVPGGHVSYAVTDGTSMLPLYHTGDLVILRKAPSYKVGDNAGYHDPDLGNAIVLHQVWKIEDGKYTFKGINKDAPDSTSVPESAIVGKAWIHVPKLGVAFKWVGQPMHAAILVLIAVLLSFSGAGLAYFRGEKTPRRKRGGEGSSPALELPALPAAAGLRSEYVLPVAGTVAAVFALLTLIAFSTPKTKTLVVPDYASDTLTFAYHASAPKTPVYPTGKIRTGDTVFAKQLDRGLLFLDATYAVAPKDPTVQTHSHGKLAITMHIEGDNLWKADRVLVPPVALKPGATTIHTHLDLNKLKRLLQQVEDETGYPASQAYKLTIKANIVQDGTAGSVKLNETFAPTILLDFDKVRLYPDLGPTGTGATSFTTTQPIAGTRTTDASVNIKVATLSVPTARIVGPAGLLIALLALGVLALRTRGRKESDEPTRIAAEYGDWLVPVTHMTEQSTQFADVASFEALASLASRADRAIMHYANDTAHTYFVKEDDVVYRYTTYARAPQPAPLATPLSDQAQADETETAAETLAPAEDDFFAGGVEPLPDALPAEPAPAAEWEEPTAYETPPPVVPVEELPSIAPVFQAAPPQPIAVPTPAPVAPAAPPAMPVAPAAAAGGFVPESPETAYQPAPLSMPPIVVPQPAPGAPTASGMQPIVPLAPISPATSATPEVALIRDTFLRPRPRQGDGNGNGSGNGHTNGHSA